MRPIFVLDFNTFKLKFWMTHNIYFIETETTYDFYVYEDNCNLVMTQYVKVGDLTDSMMFIDRFVNGKPNITRAQKIMFKGEEEMVEEIEEVELDEVKSDDVESEEGEVEENEDDEEFEE